jgi:uncharacterized protein
MADGVAGENILIDTETPFVATDLPETVVIEAARGENRVPGYGPEMLDQLVRSRQAFEYWSHAALYLPMQDFRFALPRMHAWQQRLRTADRSLRRTRQDVLARIRAEGPLGARDFADARHKSGGW